MDWESTAGPFPTQQSPEQPQCPYRPGADVNNFQFPPLRPLGMHGGLPYNPIHPSAQGQWSSFQAQNTSNRADMANRYMPMHGLDVSERLSDPSNSGYRPGLESLPPLSYPTDHASFDPTRPLRRQNYMFGSSATPGNGRGFPPAANHNPVTTTTSTSARTSMERAVSLGGVQADNDRPIGGQAPSRLLPPPAIGYGSQFGYYPPPPPPYPRHHRYSADLLGSGSGPSKCCSPYATVLCYVPLWRTTRGSCVCSTTKKDTDNSQPPRLQPPYVPQEARWGHVSFAPLHSPAAWSQDMFYPAPVLNADSDDESMDHSSEGSEDSGSQGLGPAQSHSESNPPTAGSRRHRMWKSSTNLKYNN
jgi:hypothetical protein